MKLQVRFTLAFSSLILVALAFAGVLIYWAEDAYVVRKTHEDQVRALENFAAGCAATLRAKGDAGLVDYVFSVARSSAVAFSGLYSADGVALYHSDAALRGVKVLPTEVARRLSSSPIVEFFGPDLRTGRQVQVLSMAVRDGSKSLRIAAMGYDPEILKVRRGRILRNNLQRIVWVALGALAVGVLLAAYLAAILVRPIRALAGGARQIGSGDLAHRIESEREDELGDLASEFNKMAGKLQELDRLKEEFLASVTHELRSPMASVTGFADLVLSGQGGPLTPQQEDWLETLRKSAKRLSGMVDNILDSAKLDAGKLELAPEETPVGELAEEVAESFEPVAREQKVSLAVQSRESSAAWADPETVRQVLINLLSNALKFSPEGGAVRVEVSDEPPPSKGVLVKVSDTGPGIPEEALGRLCSKFFQVKETKDKASGKGSGLGLYICKRLIEAQGGRIWAESSKGGGIFYFTLPARPG